MRKRSIHNLSNQINLTFDPGILIPLDYWDVLPGDTFQVNTGMLIRSTPLLAPVMHPLIVRLNYWFVPHRLIWDDSEDFHTGGSDGTSTPVHPVIQLAAVAESSLYNYMGLPVDTYGATLDVDALPFRAYSTIWNQHFRDQDLATLRTLDTTSGIDSTTDVTLAKVAWPKDYFTTARPWEQKGTAVTIPLLGESPIFGDGMDFDDVQDNDNLVQVRNIAGSSGSLKLLRHSGNASDPLYGSAGSAGTAELKADLSQATGIDIADLRLSLGLQKFMEDMSRGGSRYSEYLRSMFEIRSSDSRQNIPEYLGGGKSVIQFSEVLSTDSGGSDPVGDMKGHGIAAMRSNRFRRFFEEHGIMMCLLSVVPKPMYMNGIARKFTRTTKEDYFQHQLQYIGEQEVYNKELYAAHGTPDGVFGYQARYDEYRTQQSRVCGEFNSTLNHWHLARDFGTNPALNETFIECTPTTRTWASTATHKFLASAYNRVAARRMITKRATTKLM